MMVHKFMHLLKDKFNGKLSSKIKTNFYVIFDKKISRKTDIDEI